MTHPGSQVAVVICTRGRADVLEDALDALARQTRHHELVVIDDDSPDRTPELLAERGIRHFRTAHQGQAAGRQLGWRATSAPIVVFTDDDCVPTPGWLDALVRPIEEDRADVVQGRTLPRPDQLDRMGPWSRTQRVEAEDGFYQTCNIAYRREALEAVGGFSPAFTGGAAAGEDTDLAWRVKKAGFRTTFARDALVYHAVWPSSWWSYLKDRPRWSKVALVARRHPEVRSLAHRRYFYRPSHERALVALTALAVASRFRWWAPLALTTATAAAYVIHTRDSPEPAPKRVLHLAQVFAVDVYETAAFARASVKYRTLLL